MDLDTIKERYGLRAAVSEYIRHMMRAQAWDIVEDDDAAVIAQSNANSAMRVRMDSLRVHSTAAWESELARQVADMRALVMTVEDM